MQQLQTCMGSTEIQNFIFSGSKEGEVLNIQSTPSLYINNKTQGPRNPNPNFLKVPHRTFIKEIILL